jgi:hypothetical protein
MPTRLQAEIHRVVNAAVKDATDLGANPLHSIMRGRDAVRITTRRKRHSNSHNRSAEREFWTEFYLKEGSICAQDGWSADSDVLEGEARYYETLHGFLNLSDVYEAAKKLASILASQS